MMVCRKIAPKRVHREAAQAGDVFLAEEIASLSGHLSTYQAIHANQEAQDILAATSVWKFSYVKFCAPILEVGLVRHSG